MADLMELAELVVALSGPDREMDCMIAVAISTWPDARVIWHKGYRRYYRAGGVGRVPFPVAGGKGTDWGIAFKNVDYTGSLDAAMTLYPVIPDRIPSNPRIATAEALRARASNG